jgi:hypothetical protein
MTPNWPRTPTWGYQEPTKTIYTKKAKGAVGFVFLVVFALGSLRSGTQREKTS